MIFNSTTEWSKAVVWLFAVNVQLMVVAPAAASGFRDPAAMEPFAETLQIEVCDAPGVLVPEVLLPHTLSTIMEW